MGLADDAVSGITHAVPSPEPHETEPPKIEPTWSELAWADYPSLIDNHVNAILDALSRERDREFMIRAFGSPENPYDLYVPGWLEQRCLAELGKTAQEMADDLWQHDPEVKVTVVKPW